MTFQYDHSADSLWVSLSEPTAVCVYMESDTPGVILRVEEPTGIIRGFEIVAWSRRVEKGSVLIPEIDDAGFREQWLREIENHPIR